VTSPFKLHPQVRSSHHPWGSRQWPSSAAEEHVAEVRRRSSARGVGGVCGSCHRGGAVIEPDREEGDPNVFPSFTQRHRTSHCDIDGSGAMEDVSPIFCSPVQYCFAIAFHVVVTVAMPDMCASTVILKAFLRLTVLTTLVIAMDT